MQAILDKLTHSLSPLTTLPEQLDIAYKDQQQELLAFVNRKLEDHPRCHELIGYQPLRLMHNNHHNHFRFIHLILHFQLYELLVTTVPWVLHTYTRHGFLYDYFPTELEAWREGFRRYLTPQDAAQIDILYQWLLDHLDELYELAERYIEDGESTTAASLECQLQHEFLQTLLAADNAQVLRLAQENITSPAELQDFYLRVIEPSMDQIGQLWARGEISVAQEHLASALVSRLMASSLYAQFALQSPKYGKVIMTAVEQEQHEIGARMVADFLSMDGWDVLYLGANTPGEELLSLLNQQDCCIIGLSATMPYHLLDLETMIQRIRENPAWDHVKVMVGGQAFLGLPTFWQRLGADGFATNAEGARELAATWR